MAAHERSGATDEWYTPQYVFDALGEKFDLDVAAPENRVNVVTPARRFSTRAQPLAWRGFVWMNPPFGGRNAVLPWVRRFLAHGNGIALLPNRTGAPWWQEWANGCEALVFVAGKIKFVRPDGSLGISPGYGNVLGAVGARGCAALARCKLGLFVEPRQ